MSRRLLSPESRSQTRSRSRKPAPPTSARRRSVSWRSDFDRDRIGRGLLRATVNDGRDVVAKTAPAAERPSRTPARPRGFFSFGRFRVLFDSLFRVLFNFPSRYLFAVGLAVGVEPRMGRTTRLRAAFSNDPTLEPTRRFDLEARARCGPDTLAGPNPIGESCARSPLGLLRLPPVLAPHVDGRPLGRPDSALGSVRFSTIVVSLHSPLLRKPQLVSFSTA